MTGLLEGVAPFPKSPSTPPEKVLTVTFKTTPAVYTLGSVLTILEPQGFVNGKAPYYWLNPPILKTAG